MSSRASSALIALKFLNLEQMIQTQLRNSLGAPDGDGKTAPVKFIPINEDEFASRNEEGGYRIRPQTANVGYVRSKKEQKSRGREIYFKNLCSPNPPNIQRVRDDYCSPSKEAEPLS